jgi:rubrerythrin
MSLDIWKQKGVALERQEFDWKDMVPAPLSKLDDDAFSRVRVILMNGIESEAIRFSHAAARMNEDHDLRVALARVRRVEQHQQTLVNWLNPADLSPLETTFGFEQVAIEVTASLALHEPDAYLAQMYRFGLLEDFDHLYRFAALGDRLFGIDVNNILNSYTDVMPGRPTVVEHRHPEDDVRRSYDKRKAKPLTKLNALTLVAAENQVHDYYMTIGPMFADPLARQLYAEIASIEEQHVTHYESLIDATETWLEKWLMHEAVEVYNYYSCYMQEPNPRAKKTWERFVDYELGHLQFVAELMERVEDRDPRELVPAMLPDPVEFSTHRKFIRKVLQNEVDYRVIGTEIQKDGQESKATRQYRERINAAGSPSETVAAGYRYVPGTELSERAPELASLAEETLQ